MYLYYGFYKFIICILFEFKCYTIWNSETNNLLIILWLWPDVVNIGLGQAKEMFKSFEAFLNMFIWIMV